MNNNFDEPEKISFLEAIGAKGAFFILLLSVIVVGIIIAVLYQAPATHDNALNVPIIRADNKPIKAIPEDRGGMPIPYRDSTIFSDLNAQEDRLNKIENLLADKPNEPPIPKSELFAGLNTQTPTSDMPKDEHPTKTASNTDMRDILDAPEVKIEIEQKSSLDAQAKPSVMLENEVDNITPTDPTPIDLRPASKAMDIAQKDKEKNKEEELKNATPVVVPKPKPVEVKAHSIVSETAPSKGNVDSVVQKLTQSPDVAQSVETVMQSGSYVVQLASIKDRNLAQAQWNNFKKKYAPALNNVTYVLETAEIADKGTFYRIHTQNMNKQSASDICSQIKKINPQGCIVKKK